MNDSNNRRVASVNVPQRPSPWRGVAAFAGAAAIAGVALVAVILGLRGSQQAASPTATAVPSATSSATTPPSASPTSSAPSASPTATTYQSPLGYSIQLPSAYRRSDLQSRMTPNSQGDPNLLAIETFTARTPGDEVEAMRRSDTGVGPALIYTAHVAIYRNSRNETAMAYAEREKGGLGLIVVSVEPTTLDGRPGAKTTFKYNQADSKSFYALYVTEHFDQIWVIGYFLGPQADAAPGATEEGVRGIVESFRFGFAR